VTMHLSERISRISISTTAAVLHEAERMRAAGVDLADFGAGEPDFKTPENIREAGIRAIREGFTRYTPVGGIPELKEAVCEWHRREFGTAYSPSEVIITAGGKQAIFNTISALINPGDEVLLPVPYWVSFRDIAHYAGGRTVLLPTAEESGYRLRADEVERALTPRTRLLIVNSPNNPSGAVMEPGESRRIVELAAARGIVVMADECYSHFVYDGRPASLGALAGAREHAVVIGSMSKTFAMTGWRIGFALAPAALIEAMVRLQSHTTTNPNSIAQKAAVEALLGPQDAVREMCAEYRRRRDFIVQALRGISGIRCPLPAGSFYAFPNVSRYLSKGGYATPFDLAAALLREARVATVPGEAFGTSEHIRLSYATSMRQIEQGLARMKEFLEATWTTPGRS